MLMRYLLDELHSYEEDYSDALAPTSREAGASFAGEAALIRPATTEVLHMTRTTLTADVAVLHKAIVNMRASQDVLAENMHQNFTDMSNLIREVLAPGHRTLASPQDMNSECILLTPH